MKAAIHQWVQDHRRHVVELAQALVRFPSVNRPPHGQELECQMFVAEYLRDIGFSVDTFIPTEVKGLTDHPVYWPGRDYTDRPNVVGVRKGANDGRSLLFSGHIDVVPPIGQGKFEWWAGTVEGGRLYGRGSNDMKGGIACYLMAARCIQELNPRLQGDLILETVVDEEVAGANGTLACRLRGYQADAAIIAEPTNLTVCPGHRGGKQYRLFISGNPHGMGFATAGLPDPVVGLGHIVIVLDKYNQERNQRPKPLDLQDEVFPWMPFVIRAGEEYPWGTQDAIPDSGYLEFWIEVPPGTTEAELDGELKQVVDEAMGSTPGLQFIDVQWKPRTRFLPGSSMPPDSPILDVLEENLASAAGKPTSRGLAPFGCDAFMFNLHSTTPCALLGPSGGNAHAPDEWVEIEDLVTLTETFAMTIADWCQGAN
jgi:acetylornithine deacetylase